jgi:hypothetical protein
MIISNIEEEPRTLIEYDITYSGGFIVPYTIDETAGDEVDWTTSPMSVIFKLVEKPSITDPEVKLPAEEITVFLQHVLSITKRPRIVTPITPDQKEAWKQTLHKLTGSVN